MSGLAIPDIVVISNTDKSQYAVFRLNFFDKKKPDFELIENHMLGVQYPPPWYDYYKVNPKTFETVPQK
jgi:hypothetical protein